MNQNIWINILENLSHLFTNIHQNKNSRQQTPKMQIYIERMEYHGVPSICFQVEVEPEDSVESLTIKIYRIISINPDRQRLIYQGQLMAEDKTISYYNIQEGNLIHLSIWSTRSGAWRKDRRWASEF